MFWLGFTLGIYVAGAAFTFVFVGFFCCLGGKSSELWKPFVYAAAWPIFWVSHVKGLNW